MTKPHELTSEVVSIRTASLHDAALLAELAAQTFQESFAGANTVEDMRAHAARTYSEALQSAELADVDRTTWIVESTVGEAAPQPIGYAMVRRNSRTDGVTFRAPAELERIYVVRSWHGRGAGALLMKAAIDQARRWSSDGLWLGVWEHNPAAIAFYERMGFSIVGAIPFQLGSDRQTDLVMTRAN